MFIMASHRHPSSHQLPDAPVPVLSLPGVAELLASSSPPNHDASSLRSHQSHHYDQPRFAPAPAAASHAAPAPAPAPAAAASLFYPSSNGASVAESPVALPSHHASQARQVRGEVTATHVLIPRHSPTDTTTSPSPLEYPQPHHYHQSFAPPLKTHFSPNESLQDPSHAQVPFNGHRQDSAVSQQRGDISKANRVSASPSEYPTYHHHQSPSSSRQSASPRPSTNSDSPSSFHPIGTTSYSNQPNHHQPSNYPPHRASATSPSASHLSLEGPKPHEVVAPVPPAYQDSAPGNNTRQSRYNVRFAANHTPDNMSSPSKPRQDPPPAPPQAGPRTPESDAQEEAQYLEGSEANGEANAHAAEPAVQLMKTFHADEQLRERPRRSDETVERCAGCGATWKRPLPEAMADNQRATDSSAMIRTFAEANLNILAVLSAHSKKADAHYNKWKWQHSYCVQNGQIHRTHNANPWYTPYSETAKSRPADGPLREMDGSESAGSKRKAEDSAREEHLANTKHRRVTLDTAASGPAPPVQSSTS